MSVLRALLFDLDGTLVDSVPMWIGANLAALQTQSYTMDGHTFLKEVYHAGLHYEGMLEKLGLHTADQHAFYADRDKRFAKLLSQKVVWMGDAERVLKLCKKKYLLGVMTGSRRMFIDAMDQRLELSALFSAIVTRDDTGTKMKPDAFGLVLLAKKLGVDPTTCLYVGDQHVDIAAARNAGMRSCLVVTKETPSGAEQDASFVIDDIAKLPQIC